MEDERYVMYQETLSMIRHLESRLSTTSHFYFTVLGASIPLAGVMHEFKVEPAAYIGICLLIGVIGAHWVCISTMMNLQKLCWIRHAKAIEQDLNEGFGPMGAQSNFFNDLAGQKVTWMDRAIIRQARHKRFPYLAALIVCVLALSVFIFAFVIRLNAG